MDTFVKNINLESANQELNIKLAEANNYKKAFLKLCEELSVLQVSNVFDSITIHKILINIKEKYNID